MVGKMLAVFNLRKPTKTTSIFSILRVLTVLEINILQHFTTRLCHFTNFKLFLALLKVLYIFCSHQNFFIGPKMMQLFLFYARFTTALVNLAEHGILWANTIGFDKIISTV